MPKHPLFLLLSCLALPAGAAPDAISQNQSVWRDGDTGVDVAMYDCDEDPAQLCGRIVGLPPRSAETDIHNPDVRLRQRRLLGFEIVSGFRPAGPGCWQGGGEFALRATTENTENTEEEGERASASRGVVYSGEK